MRLAVASTSPEFVYSVDADPVAVAVRDGLNARPRYLPPWLFYDATGSRLFDEITELDEYYLTRTERGILARHADEIVSAAADGGRLRIAELGAGSAGKTRLLLRAAAEQQRNVVYEPIDVSPTALAIARQRIEREISGVRVMPYVADYTRGNGHALDLAPTQRGERRLVLYIGSSIGNFEPAEASRLLRRLRASLTPGDSVLLGLDLVKDAAILRTAYDDSAGVTAAFNRNILKRINRELGANFSVDAFRHVALWNDAESRMEMYLESQLRQRVQIPALGLTVDFDRHEAIHTENSYKYESGQAEAMLDRTGFDPLERWTDARDWFAVILARVE
jgi:dimethylhistidine N-methyltransferase